MTPNRNGTLTTPNPSATKPGLGIQPKVPTHATDACCPVPPAGPTAQTLSERKIFSDQSLMGEVSSAVGPVPRLSTRLTLRDRCMECGACARNCEQNDLTIQPGVGCATDVIQTWIKGKDAACCGNIGCC